MENILCQDIKYLKGVGPARAKLLGEEMKIFTVGDLIYTFPFKYIDRTVVHTVRELHEDMPYVQLVGHILNLYAEGEGRTRRLKAVFFDRTGTVELVWFNAVRQMEKTLKVNTPYLLFGKPTYYNGRVSFAHPELEVLTAEMARQLSLARAGMSPSLFAEDDLSRGEGAAASPESLPSVPGCPGNLQPRYHTTERMKRVGFTSRQLSELVRGAFALIGDRVMETLPEYLRKQYGLEPLTKALRGVHFPVSSESLPASRKRLKFDELFFLQLSILRTARERSHKSSHILVPRVGPLFHTFYNDRLPFPLTGAQKRVIREIREDLRSGRQMNRLVQGDVGSGKTIVALMSALLVIDAGYQACIMAPTEILAAQHEAGLSALLGNIGVKCALLTSNVKGTVRKKILQQTADGQIHLLIGTHALIEKNVVFHNLGLAIIDEQHRFGVEQRSRLWDKSVRPPHVLVMTATPIPRTLAMTVYGDLSLSVIDELPLGRKPVVTLHRTENEAYDLNGIVLHELSAGRQVYIVHPLIEENEKIDLRDLETGFQRVCEAYPQYTAAKLHGKMKPQEKEEAIAGFVSGSTRILVATTVIEVGVNVPNATVMVIQNAERFGLSQLHQLRGRVGRGADKSYCILVTKSKLSELTRRRLEIMTETTDGFRIAEEDLRLRGPGDIRGTAQSGLPFNLQIAHIVQDASLMEMCREAASRFLQNDPQENLPQNAMVWRHLRSLSAHRTDFTDIS